MLEDIDDILKMAATGGIVLVGFLAVKSFTNSIKENRINSAYADASVSGSTAEMARKLKDAFDNCDMFGCAGTNEEAVIRLIQSIPNKRFFEGMTKDYARLTSGASFDVDFHDEFYSWGNNSSDNIIYDDLMVYIQNLPN
ncbi:hypothetical protein [Bernardetia sp.]|uniref:hypothetical protein n=1 Tax=Bernardetia sp. TaxID=1937974 RepID=UPI0025BACEB3|nr:hypothetical protein [Bernardetia sp.]